MKTIRVQYSDKLALDSGISKAFTIEEGKIIAPKTENCHVVVINENTVDMLVPDDFDPNLIEGTIVKQADDVVKHVFLGHETTARVIDSTGKTEIPTVKDQTEVVGTK